MTSPSPLSTSILWILSFPLALIFDLGLENYYVVNPNESLKLTILLILYSNLITRTFFK